MNDRKETPKAMTPSMPLWSYQLQRNSMLAVRTRKDLEVQLITRSLKDEAFKQELLANPKAVVEKELGMKLPEGIEINVLEESETTLYMVLPSNPYQGLAESDLKASLGMSYEDVAQWVLEQQRNAFLDQASSVAMLSRAWKDQTFKQELLCSPKTVIEREWGTTIPADIEIRVFQETAYILYLVLPECRSNLGNLEEPGWEEANLGNFQLLRVGTTNYCGTSTLGFKCKCP